jgi:hypothetical protein
MNLCVRPDSIISIAVDHRRRGGFFDLSRRERLGDSTLKHQDDANTNRQKQPGSHLIVLENGS